MHTRFIAYAEDCRVSGEIESANESRLSDILNGSPEIVLRRATIVAHADGRRHDLDELTLSRDEIVAVEALGTRGPEDRRIHTVRHRLELHLGSYVVLGQIHTMPGGQPLVAIGRRQPMIPLTNATIAYNDADGLQAHDVQTLIVNRDQAQWVRASVEDRAAFPEVPILDPVA